jgi:hypothetical protein
MKQWARDATICEVKLVLALEELRADFSQAHTSQSHASGINVRYIKLNQVVSYSSGFPEETDEGMSGTTSESTWNC